MIIVIDDDDDPLDGDNSPDFQTGRKLTPNPYKDRPETARSHLLRIKYDQEKKKNKSKLN